MQTKYKLNHSLFIFALTIFIFGAACPRLIAAPGDLDTTFGNGGKVVTPATPNDDVVERVRIQSDGKIVTLGFAQDANADQTDSFIVRHNANGTIDASFGANGLVVISIDNFQRFFDFVILPDGKLLVVGDTYSDADGLNIAIFRYLANGTRDTGFGTNGIITTRIGSQFSTGSKIALQPDGKFIVAGFAVNGDNGSDGKSAVVRYNANGTLDNTFGTNGVTLIPYDNSIFRLGEALVQNDGKLLVAGHGRFAGNIDFVVLRYNVNGTLDSSFGANGLVHTDVDNLANVIGGMVLQPDGKIVINGRTLTADFVGTMSSSVLRYNANGTLDNSFGTGGIVQITEPTPNVEGLALALAIQQNGKILTAGIRNLTFAVARYNANGTLDTTFGTNGIVTTIVGETGIDRIYSLAVQSDGKIIAAGGRNNASFFYDVVLVRYLGDPVSTAPRAVYNDFFGTGRSDYLLFDRSITAIRWDILRNPVTSPPQIRHTFWGFSASDFPAVGDYDGDLKMDVGVWRPGTANNPQSYFYIQRSSDANPNAVYSQPWGLPTDRPATGDYDGDGKDDFAVTRSESGKRVWYILPSGGGNFRRVEFGSATGDFVISEHGSDFNNDGRDDLVVIRLSSNGDLTFYIGDALTGQLILAQQWGNSRVTNSGSVFLFYGNYLGDSRADVGIYYDTCQSNPNCDVAGTFWIKETGGSNYTVTKFGVPFNSQIGAGDFPIQGDFDGDGKFDITVTRFQNKTFYSLLSSNGQLQAQYFDGNSAAPPSGRTNPFEGANEPNGKSVPANFLKGLAITKQSDGTYKWSR